jgi:hypothetical protein
MRAITSDALFRTCRPIRYAFLGLQWLERMTMCRHLTSGGQATSISDSLVLMQLRPGPFRAENFR